MGAIPTRPTTKNLARRFSIFSRNHMPAPENSTVDLENAEDVAVLAEAETSLSDVSDVLQDEVAAVRTLLVGLADAPQQDFTEVKERLLKRVPAPSLNA